MASPRDQRLRAVVIDASKTVSERREALLQMSAPSRKWLGRLVAATATPPHLRSAAEGRLADIEASRNAKREAARHASSTPPAQPIAASEPVPVAAPMAATQASVADLLTQGKARTLAEIDYVTVHRYGAAHGWSPQAMEVFDVWRIAYFKTPAGREELARIAGYLRKHDFDQWRSAADEWKDSGYKDGRRLIAALETIVASPQRGNYHHLDTVEGAATFLAEVRRRCQ